VNYQVGDIDIKQTKYTLWNYDEEGQVNESSVFSIPRSIIHYDNFYTDHNTWRVQGMQTDFAFKIANLIEKIKFDGNMSFVNLSKSEMMGGGSMDVKQSKWLNFGVNYMNTYQVTSISDSGFYNPVITGNAHMNLTHGDLKTTLGAEIGRSSLSFTKLSEAPTEQTGGLYEISAKVKHEPTNLSLNVSFRSVSNTFFSAGAQTKRINFDALNNLFPFVGTTNVVREKYLWDLTRDENSYNRNISSSLASYNPMYANTLPYGNATPNRQGLTADLVYSDNKVKWVDAFLTAAFLTDIVGQGTLQQKHYALIKLGGNIYINRLIGVENKIKINFGLQSDNASRSGNSYEQVNYSTNLIDLGADIEIVKRFELLIGLKYLRAKGNDFYVVRNTFNQVTDYLAFNQNSSQTMFGGGLKYSFSQKIYITVQDNMSVNTELDSSNNINLNQLYMLFNMTF
jgi:hypothetical protein